MSHLTSFDDNLRQMTSNDVIYRQLTFVMKRHSSFFVVNFRQLTFTDLTFQSWRFTSIFDSFVVFWRFWNFQKFWKKFRRFSSKNDDKWLWRHFLRRRSTSNDVELRQSTSNVVKWRQLTLIYEYFCIITKNFASNH